MSEGQAEDESPGQALRNAPAYATAAPAARFAIDTVKERFRRYSYRPITDDEGEISAAVLVPLYVLDDELHVVLTKRTNLMSKQQGHIAFPGGRRESGDPDLLTTALRESFEEIGLDPARVEILCRIDDFSTHNGQTFVAGFVGMIDPAASPYAWQPQQREVAEMLEVPVRELLDARNWTVKEPRELNGRLWPDEDFHFRGHRTFGATARAMRNVLDIAFK